MRDRGRRCSIGALLLACAAVFVVSVTHAETLELHLRLYCGDPHLCGFDSQEHYEAKMKEVVHELNVEWRPTGIAFHPVFHPIEELDADHPFVNPWRCETHTEWRCSDGTPCHGDDAYCEHTVSQECLCSGDCVCADDVTVPCSTHSLCQYQGLGQCSEGSAARVKHWIDEVAAHHPRVITAWLTQTSDRSCVAGIPTPDGSSRWSNLGFFATGNPWGSMSDKGTIWAHELGHYFCLAHTHSGEDFAQTQPDPPDHDGDTLADTPPDPAPSEFSDWICQEGECGIGTTKVEVRYLHEFCRYEPLDAVDDGSPHDSRCLVECRRCYGAPCVDFDDMTPIAEVPHTQLSMSYYDPPCLGPYVVAGHTFEAFSRDQIDRVVECRENHPQRSVLWDYCERRDDVDQDLDGVCDSADNCAPLRDPGCSYQNTTQVDSDGDGLGDACDLCPEVDEPTEDLDGDCIGDLCDWDIDGDTCWNTVDQHPEQKMIERRTLRFEGCSIDREVELIHEGEDWDHDGVINCRDLDDDNDGICDLNESSGYDPDRGVVLVDGCGSHPTGEDPCPFDAGDMCQDVPGTPGDCAREWVLACRGSSCFEFFVKISHVVNPDPTTDMIFERFQIFNRTLYLNALPDRTLSQSALALAGAPAIQAASAGGGAAEELVKMEIWERGANAYVATVVGAYDASALAIGPTSHGTVLAVTPDYSDPVGPVLHVESRYAIGLRHDASLPDRDLDGRPDSVDNCLETGNFTQVDADGDGFGDACDPDLDGDGRVTQNDVDLVAGCRGADLTLSMPISEPESLPGDRDQPFGFAQEGPDPEAYALSLRCGAADLDGNRFVDVADESIALEWQDRHPGPSVRANLPPVALAGPDQVVGCPPSGFMSVDGSASYDPEGLPVSCAWSSSTCVMEWADRCITDIGCPDGGNDLQLSVNDGSQDSAPDTVSVFIPDCAAPGRIEENIRLGWSGSRLVIRWSPSCLPGARDYGIYEGTLGNWYDHQPRDCFDNGTKLEEAIGPGSGNRYYLVVPWTGQHEGSYGRRSDGTERPRALVLHPCAPLQALDECPPPVHRRCAFAPLRVYAGCGGTAT